MKKDIINKNDNGHKHGIQIGYHYNGNIWYKDNYINGKEHGEHIRYYNDGQIHYKENYINGDQVDQEEWIAYDRRSKLDIIKDL
jgi:antitoxin component YwqK of YwqJK toxin-antitoxin module